MVPAKKRSKPLGVRAWAWEFDGGLCRWAMPTKEQLAYEGQPTPEAVPVMVYMVRAGEYNKLKKATNG